MHAAEPAVHHRPARTQRHTPEAQFQALGPETALDQVVVADRSAARGHQDGGPGLAGSAAAVILLVLGKEIALPAILGHITESSDAHALTFAWTALILLGFGVLIGAAGSGVTIRRFLKI